MSAMNNSLFLGGIFVALSLQSSIAQAEVAAPAAASSVAAVPTAPADPKKLVEQAEQKLDDEDLAAAIYLYDQAARLNYTPAQVQMGDFAVSGEFFDTAVGWYLTAAMQGDAAGQYHLGQMYQSGRGIEKDDMKALYWYRRSAAQDYVPAIKVIAFAYRKGGFSGQIPLDLDRARTWDTKAAHLEAAQRKAADAAMEEKRKAKAEAIKKAAEAEKK